MHLVNGSCPIYNSLCQLHTAEHLYWGLIPRCNCPNQRSYPRLGGGGEGEGRGNQGEKDILRSFNHLSCSLLLHKFAIFGVCIVEFHQECSERALDGSGNPIEFKRN